MPFLLMSCLVTEDDRVAEYNVKLMDIDADTLGIPSTDYDARVTMPSRDFTRIVRDLSSLGESVRIVVSKEGISFASDGEAAQGSILLKQTDAAREKYENYGKDDEDDDDVVEAKEEDADEKPKKVKKEKVKREEGVEDEDEEMASGEDEEAEFQAKSEDDEEEQSDSEKKKRKRPATTSSVRFSFVPCERLVTDCTGLESKKESQESSW